jgi:hypothetical protein
LVCEKIEEVPPVLKILLPPKAGVLAAPKAGVDDPNPWDKGEPKRLPAGCDWPNILVDPKGDEAPTLLGVFRLPKVEPVKPGVLAPKIDVPAGVDPNVFVPNAAPVLAPNGDGVDPNAGALACCPKADCVEGAPKGDWVCPKGDGVCPNAGAGVDPNAGVDDAAPNPVAGFCAPNIPEEGVEAKGFGVVACWPKLPVAAAPKGLAGVVPKIPGVVGCCPPWFGPPTYNNND